MGTQLRNIGMFVVPNPSSKADGYYVESFRRRCHEINRHNNAPENDNMIQSWFFADDSVISGEHCDNCAAHGWIETDENGKRTGYRLMAEVIPYHVAQKVHEGEAVQITLPVIETDMGDDYDDSVKHEPEWVTFNVKAEQLPYRYRRFGNYEDVVRYVMR